MDYVFSAANQALWAADKLVQVTTQAGQVLPILRDPVTGRFVEIAKSVVSTSAQPLISPVQFAMSGLQTYQNNQGFTDVLKGLSTLQSSLGVLQATTAVIGVGVAAGVALSAVNLHQTLKLREDVKKLRLEVKDGFIDLKQALRSHGAEIIQRIDEIAQDVEFKQHRLALIRAYGKFLEATQLMKTAMSLQDQSARKVELANARQTFGEALADYNNPHLLSETCAAGQLRRLECAWAIEQALALTYQLQDEPTAASERLVYLQEKIRQDAITVINRCEFEDEMDFLFPEIKRIYDHDLAVLNTWQNHIDWARTLPSSELKLLSNADFKISEISNSSDTDTATSALAIPLEQLLYENLQQKSHFFSLGTQLRFMMKPELRQESELYISQQAASAGYKTLVSTNLQKASDLAVANLYWYFKVREESEEAAVA